MNEISNLSALVSEINFYKNQTVIGIVEIGKRLSEAKKKVPHGEWGQWLKSEVDFSQSNAIRFIKIAEEFPNYATSHNLSVSKAFELLSLPSEERQEFIDSHNIEDMTTRELREAIKRVKQLEEDNGEFIKRITELSNQPPIIKEVVKEVTPADYAELKSQYKKLQSDSSFHKERAERIYQDNQALILENQKIKKSDQVDEFDAKLNTTALTLSMRTRKFLEDVGGMVWILDYYNKLDGTDREIINISINSLFGWVMSMKNQIEEDKS